MGISLGHLRSLSVSFYEHGHRDVMQSTVAGLRTGEVGRQPVCIKTSRETCCGLPKAGIRWHLAKFSHLILHI